MLHHRQFALPLAALALSGLVIGCAGQTSEPDGSSDPSALETEPGAQNQGASSKADEGEPLVAPVEDPGPVTDPKAIVFKAGDKVMTGAVANLRYDVEGTTRGDIVRVVAEGTELTVVSDGGLGERFLRATIGELPVLAARAGLKKSTSGVDGATQPAVARALSAVGFSYYWGHGSWTKAGTSIEVTGSCSGGCPDCTHSGRFGADCSGLVAKAWQVPSTNTDVTKDSHPFSTADMVGASKYWSFVDRSKVLAGDALAYNADGKGHTFIYKNGDGWGSFWSVEARGCNYGITYNLRTAGSNYKTLRKK